MGHHPTILSFLFLYPMAKHLDLEEQEQLDALKHFWTRYGTLITGVLMFDDAGTALMLAIFALQDSFGTACNITGDGALTLMLTGYVEKHHIQENGNLESPIL